jgi:Domain of unknown function (DUF4129)
MIAALLAALLAAPLGLPAYRARLEKIDALLLAGDRARAAAAAQKLLGEKVQAGEEEIVPAAWALEPIARGDPHRSRLRGLIDGLAQGGLAPSPAADRKLLEALRRAQDAAGPAAGGKIAPLAAPELPFFEQVLSWMGTAARWIASRLGDLWNWLAGLFPTGTARQLGLASSRITGLVLIGVGLIVVLVVALAVLSRARPPPVLAVRSRSVPEKDEDPLSRSAGGWEARARDLAAQGRAREAIRAWYHALLVHCYGAGVLHYRRGRTNWEYAHALSPSLLWRPRFEELTRWFDLEWYGRAESTPAALEAFSTGTGETLSALGRRP